MSRDIWSWGGDFCYFYLSEWGGDPNLAEIQFFRRGIVFLEFLEGVWRVEGVWVGVGQIRLVALS